MKAKITAKSELRLSDLTREYTFDIVDDDKSILTSQVITSRPSEVVGQIQKIDETSGMSITWGGTGAFDQEWDERAGTVVYA